MELAALPLLGSFVFLVFFIVRLVVKSLEKRSPRLLPGPWQLPLVGSLHHVLLSRYGDLPHRALRELSGRHGPLMLLRFGTVPTLVISSAEAAREVLKTHDTAFASRHLTPTLAVFSRGGQDILFSPYGDLWRQLRRICVLELFSARRVQSFRHIREDEAAGFLRSVADECARGGAGAGAVVDIGERISRMINDTLVRSAVGGRCPRRDEYLRELDRSVNLTGGFNLTDLYPSSRLARLLCGALRETERCNRNLRAIMDDIIRDRAAAADGSEENLLGVLLRLQRDGDVQCPLTTDIINTVIMEIFAAGSESSSTTLEWAMSELIRNPRVLHKAQAEVREAFKGQGKLTEGDINKLSYLHLVIRETLRLHAPVPFLLPRQCREPCEVMGYDVPEGTKVLVNVWAMCREGAYWEDAEAFAPERFEGSAAAVDFKGGDFEYIPFGAGRRICPGVALGLANIELVFASLLYHFDWELPGGGRPEELDMAEAFGFAIRRKSKLVLRATQRIPCAH